MTPTDTATAACDNPDCPDQGNAHDVPPSDTVVCGRCLHVIGTAAPRKAKGRRGQ